MARLFILFSALLTWACLALASADRVLPESDIRASRVVNHPPGSLPAVPVAVFQGVDMMNLFVVVEAGDHHVTLLDGDKLKPIHRFASREDVRGDPAFTPDGRYVFFAARDGWVTKFDIWNLVVVAEIRAGIDTRNLAVSGDGKYLAVANDLPNTLVLMDADLHLLKVLDVTDKNGKLSSRVSAVYDAAPRKSFIAALKDVAEVWEISYDPTSEDIAVGMVHDFQYKEGAFVRGFLNPRRSFLSEPLEDLSFSPSYTELMGTGRETGKGQVVNLDVRRKIADLSLPDKTLAHIAFTRDGKYALASLWKRKADGGALIVFDAAAFQEIKRIPMDKPVGKYNLFNQINRSEGNPR